MRVVNRARRATGAAIAVLVAASGLAVGTSAGPAASEGVGPADTGGSGLYLAPYYLEGDLTGDDQVTSEDIDLLVAALGTTSDDAGWADVEAADFDGDLTITVADLAQLAQRVVYDDGSFELVEATAVEIQAAMNAGVITSVELTQQYLDRIAAYDATVVDVSPTGRALNSIIATSDDALEAAAASDTARAENGGPSSMLDGIPVLLKDNYDTEDLPTTAGCGCWEANQTADDATMVAGLRDAGAIVLGKASLDEFAFGFVSEYSAGSPVGSTKLVASPYRTERTAGGSSGGTGSAIAANLAVFGFGTDTGGSIRVPSSYNQLVGLRPTVGLTSRDGIVPLALSQDTGGPMARTVSDAAISLDAVVGSDPADPATAGTDAELPESYTSYLDPGALEGKRIGYLPAMVSSNATVSRLWADAVADLEAQGATVEPITIDGIGPILSEPSGSTNEFKHDLDEYVANHLAPGVGPRSLAEIIASGHFVTSRQNTYTTRNNVTPETYATWMANHTAVLASGQQLVTGALDANDLDALIYPSGTPYGTFSTNMRLSPNTGMPAIAVPMGQATDDEAIPGAGVNLEFLGRDYGEGELIGLAYGYEQATRHRTTPALYPGIEGDLVDGPGTDEDPAGDGAVTVSAADRVRVGTEVEVNVEVWAADLYGYGLDVEFDPERLAYVPGSAESGTTGVTHEEVVDGSVTITHTKLGTSPGAQGDTVLATLTFSALRPGRTDIDVADLVTVDSAGATAVSETAGTGAIVVTKVPTTLRAQLKPTVVSSGDKVRVVARVAAGGVVPTGRVTVKVGARTLRAKPRLVDGKARLSFAATGRGRKKVTVRFLPTERFGASRDVVILRVKR